jgi:secondary thiamine-phosphate synthase enzyme
MAASLFVSVEQGAGLRVCRDLVHLRTEKPLQFIDLTAVVAERVRRSGIGEGIVTVQSRHTTAALVVNENEPLLVADLEDCLERFAPRLARYRHNDLEARPLVLPEERPNGHAHAQALLLSPSVCLSVSGGSLELGEWQSVFVVELDGPRPRTVCVQVLGVAPSSEPERA